VRERGKKSTRRTKKNAEKSSKSNHGVLKTVKCLRLEFQKKAKNENKRKKLICQWPGFMASSETAHGIHNNNNNVLLENEQEPGSE
jgi:hypothetical protein